jgi:ABC-type phosphate/phosphonate transport system substrate-binding protein
MSDRSVNQRGAMATRCDAAEKPATTARPATKCQSAKAPKLRPKGLRVVAESIRLPNCAVVVRSNLCINKISASINSENGKSGKTSNH